MYTIPQSLAILQIMQHCKSQVPLFYSLEIVGKIILEMKYQPQMFMKKRCKTRKTNEFVSILAIKFVS